MNRVSCSSAGSQAAVGPLGSGRGTPAKFVQIQYRKRLKILKGGIVTPLNKLLLKHYLILWEFDEQMQNPCVTKKTYLAAFLTANSI